MRTKIRHIERNYPINWNSEIRPRILQRDKYTCQHCGKKHNQIYLDLDKIKYMKTLLQVAHLDHDKWNKDIKDERLLSLCEVCHAKNDSKYKQEQIRITSGRRHKIFSLFRNSNPKSNYFIECAIKEIKKEREKFKLSIRDMSFEFRESIEQYEFIENGGFVKDFTSFCKYEDKFRAKFVLHVVGGVEELTLIDKNV